MNKFYLAYFVVFLGSICSGQNWGWAKSGASTASNEGFGVCTDVAGNVFITGGFGPPNIVFGAYTLTNAQLIESEVYLTKYDPNGNVVWAKSSIGTGNNYGRSVCSDPTGNIYVSGYFIGSNIIFDSYTLTNTGNHDVFLVKYDPNGNVVWARSGISSGDDFGYAVNSDAAGNILISGYYGGGNITFGSYTLTASGVGTTFLTKYDANGNVLWARNAITSTLVRGYGIDTDNSGNVYFVGYYAGSAPIFGTYTLTGGSVFITKYDPNGNILWAKGGVGSLNDYAYSVATNTLGESYVAGYFVGPSIVFDTFTLTNSGGGNSFLVKYDTNGNVIWARSALITAGSSCNGFCVSADLNSVFLSGSFSNTAVFGTYTITAPGVSPDPMFVAVYDFNGNVTSVLPLTSGGDDINGVAVDNFCNAYITGDFIGNPNNFVVGSNTLASLGQENIFVAKLSYTSTNCLIVPDGLLSERNLNVLLISPNPNFGSFQIQIDDEITKGEIILINSIGQKVYEQKIVQGINYINPISLSSGLYHYILLSDNQKINSGKMVVE